MLSRVFQGTAMSISWKFVPKFFKNVLVGLGTASILARYPVVCGSPEGLRGVVQGYSC